MSGRGFLLVEGDLQGETGRSPRGVQSTLCGSGAGAVVWARCCSLLTGSQRGMGGTGGHGEPSLWPEHGFPSALPHPPPASVFGENNSQGDTSLV